MHRISIACRSKMLIDCLLAYSKDGGNFGLGLAASRPEDAFSLALAQDWTLAHGRDPDDPPRAGQCKGADNFGDMKHFARDLPVRTNGERARSTGLARQMPGDREAVADAVFASHRQHMPIAFGHGDELRQDRKSDGSGKRVSYRVDLGGGRITK